MTCEFCGAPLSPERAAIYRHCTGPSCVAVWRASRLEEFRLDLVPTLMRVRDDKKPPECLIDQIKFTDKTVLETLNA